MPVILVINPGSTSTKLACFDGTRETAAAELAWNLPAGLRGDDAARELDRYTAAIRAFLTDHALVPDAVVGRGGFLRRPAGGVLRAGVYQIVSLRDGRAVPHDDLIRAVTEDPELDHASNYGIPAAARLALAAGIPAFTVDPVVVDELQELARFSGYAPVTRRSVAHVLSIRAMCRRAAEEMQLDFATAPLVAAHLGGGITVAAVRGGRIVDCSLPLLGGGPFSPQRVGTLPMSDLIDLCYSGRFTRAELHRELTKRGGLMSYLGDDDMIRIEQRIAGGDRHAATVVAAMVYQIAKEIGAMSMALGTPPAAIVCSGGLARAAAVMEPLRARVAPLAPLCVYPGSLEMAAMAHGAWRVLTGRETPVPYSL